MSKLLAFVLFLAFVAVCMFVTNVAYEVKNNVVRKIILGLVVIIAVIVIIVFMNFMFH